MVAVEIANWSYRNAVVTNLVWWTPGKPQCNVVVEHMSTCKTAPATINGLARGGRTSFVSHDFRSCTQKLSSDFCHCRDQARVASVLQMLKCKTSRHAINMGSLPCTLNSNQASLLSPHVISQR